MSILVAWMYDLIAHTYLQIHVYFFFSFSHTLYFTNTENHTLSPLFFSLLLEMMKKIIQTMSMLLPKLRPKRCPETRESDNLLIRKLHSDHTSPKHGFGNFIMSGLSVRGSGSF